MTILGDALSQAINAKNNDVNTYVWKGPKIDLNGHKTQTEVKLIDMDESKLQSCFDHCVSMLYNKDKENPGRYVLLNIIKEQRMKCNAELFMRYIENTYMTSNRAKCPRFRYQEDIRTFLHNNESLLAETYGIVDDGDGKLFDKIKELPIGILNGIPDDFAAIPIRLVIDACLDSLGIFNKKHITINFITKLPLWFTPQEMKDLTEKDANGKIRNRLEVIKERLNIKNNIRLIIDGENSKLNYTEFRAAIQLKNKNYSQLTTDQLLLLQNKLLFYLEDEIDVHIKQWESRIAQIDEVRKLKGYDLRING